MRYLKRAQTVVRHIAGYSLASLVSGLAAFLNSFLAAAIMGPAAWGTWQAAKLVIRYTANLHFGVPNGMHREIPILRGRGEVEDQKVIANVTFTFVLFVSLLVALGILAISLAFDLAPDFQRTLWFVAAIVFLQFFSSYSGLLLRANNQFDVVSKVALIGGIGSAVSIAFVLAFGFLGFLVGQTLRQLAIALYSLWKCSSRYEFAWNQAILKRLLRIGFPIMLMLLVYGMFVTVDRLLILRYLDSSKLGVYSLATLVFSPILVMFTATNSVMYPRFAERYGRTGIVSSLSRLVLLPIELLSTLAILVGGIYIALPWLVCTFLPEYEVGIQSARILLFGLFFFSLSGISGNLMLTINKQVLRLQILAVGVLANAGLSFLALKFRLGIEGVALATSFLYAAFFFVSGWVALRFTGIGSWDALKALAWRTRYALFYLALVVCISHMLGPLFILSEASFTRMIIEGGVFLLVGWYPIVRSIALARSSSLL